MEPLVLQRVYEQVPLEKRICEGCGKQIQRNVALMDGKLYHWGCMKKAKAKPVYLCLDCWSHLTREGTTKIHFPDEFKPMRACANCGSTHLRSLRKKSRVQVYV